MNNNTINQFNSQYELEGGCWNRDTCQVDGKIETYSGPGSLIMNTDLLVLNLNKFIKDYNIKSIIDIPCGDFNYMSTINLENVDYIGYDVSVNAINMCNNKNDKSNIKFGVLDATKEELSYADLIIVKDLFLHLSFEDIEKILSNVKNSKCKYFATSRYSHGTEQNINQPTGLSARAIEVTTHPFYFNYPIIFKTYYTSLSQTTKQWMKDEIIFFKLN